jgi:alcohol dehydrogenase (NADP+)
MFARSPRLSSASSRITQVSSHIQQRNMATAHKLNTGASIPALGFGTWQDKEDQEKAVTAALDAGYRHIDTARSQYIPKLPFCY